MTRVRTADSDTIAEAANVLRRGGLVAFPTETVYGLGANALDPAAVARIFEAKGRPAANPVIVHVVGATILGALTRPRSPEIVARLAERFWPGPLTLVLPKTAEVPDIVTAGGPTVAVRVPAHPVALALLRACGVPLAAPSANRSTELSPTTARHVVRSLGDRVDLILDGGPTTGGIESTVLDLTTEPPRILRPGLVTAAQIEAIVGPIRSASEPEALATERLPTVANAPGPVARSPGMMAKHYAPRAVLEIAGGDGRKRVEELIRAGKRVGWLTWTEAEGLAGAVRINVPADPAGYAARLYAALHDLDAADVDQIVAAEVPDGDAWVAIRDRLRRAATQ